MDDEFARFQAELSALGAVEPPAAPVATSAPKASPAAAMGTFLPTHAPPPNPVAIAMGTFATPAPPSVPAPPPVSRPQTSSIDQAITVTAEGMKTYGSAAGLTLPSGAPMLIPIGQVKPPGTVTAGGIEKKKRPAKAVHRGAAEEKWVDNTLNEWPEGDFRLFCGDLGNEVTEEVLSHAFGKYKSYAKSKVVRDKWSRKSKGYGFVSFLDATDAALALREMNGKYVGNRPIKLRRSTWEERDLKTVQKRDKLRKKELKKIMNAAAAAIAPPDVFAEE